jgi:putative methyltransferase (TIGR04325 family)
MVIRSYIRKVYNILRVSSYGWTGNYKTWNDAARQATGYNQENILQKVKEATLKVKRGEAVYERDSVLFDEIQYSWPLLSSIMWVAALNKGNLKVLDFGGSLGSSYFQNKHFLDSLNEISWDVVEQENFVRCGRDFIQDSKLNFFNSVEEVIRVKGLPDILVISCVLPYVEKPYLLVEQLMQYNIPNIIIDNTYFNYKPEDRICIQKVPTEIYEASYPCWLLNYNKLLSTIKEKYTIVSEHQNDSSINIDGKEIRYKGFLAKTKSK